MANCEKCGATLGSLNLGGLCPRCLIASGLEEGEPGLADTSRIDNPFFQRSFGDYDLLEEIARGGMGVVYKARQRILLRTVALKVLTSGEFASPQYVQRFRAEATAAARLQHPNIVSIHEIGEHDGVRYFTMDFVEGPNLTQFMGGRALEAKRAAVWVKTIAEAIAYAHQQGILHRDLKPSNVLIDPFGEPRVTDFGLAKELTGGSDLTVTGQVLGTPGFMPPEQADASWGAVTTKSDVYSLGAILYFLLTARAPFVAGSLQEILRQVMTEDPVAPRLLNPEVPRDVETICLKCLERDSGRRYESAQALAEDLLRFLAGEPILARPISAAGVFIRWCRRRPALAAAWMLAGILTIASTTAAIIINKQREDVSSALARVQTAETAGRERLREARIAEARAVRRTRIPGRRERMLAALKEAAGIRPGPDIRDEAIAALTLADVREIERWDMNAGAPIHATFDPSGRVVAEQYLGFAGGEATMAGFAGGEATIMPWAGKTPLSKLGIFNTNRAVGTLRFSNDGEWVMARLADNSVRIWQVTNGQPVLSLTNRPYPGVLEALEADNDDYVFAPDKKFFAVGLPVHGVSLHRSLDGAEIARWEGTNLYTTLRMAPDGRHLAAGNIWAANASWVDILEIPSLKRLHRLDLLAPFSGVAWSADARSVAVVSSDTTVALFDIAKGTLLRKLSCPGVGPGEVNFLGGASMLALRGKGTTLRLVDAATGLEELVINDYSNSQITPLPGGDSFVISSVAGVARRMVLERPVGLRTFPPPTPDGYEYGGFNHCLDFTPDGRWVVTSHGRYTLVRDARNGELLDTSDSGHPSGVEFATIILFDEGRSLLRLSTITGFHRQDLAVDAEGVPHLVRTEDIPFEPGWIICDHRPDNRLLLVRPEKNEVMVVSWNGHTVEPISRWQVKGAGAGAFSPDGTEAIINCNGMGPDSAQYKLRLYRVSDGAVLKDLPAPISADVAWSADGKTVLTSNGQAQSILWDTSNWTRRATITGEMGGDATTFCFSPDGKYTVIGHQNSIALVDLDGRVFANWELPKANGFPAAIRFLPDRQHFAVLGNDSQIDVVDPEALRRGVAAIGINW